MNRVLIYYTENQLCAISEEVQDIVMAVNVFFECDEGVLGEVEEDKFKQLTPHQRAQFLIDVGKRSRGIV